MLLGVRTVCWHVGVLGGLKIRPPPIGDHLGHCPLCFDAIVTAEGSVDDADYPLLLTFSRRQLTTWQFEEGCTYRASFLINVHPKYGVIRCESHLAPTLPT